MYYKVIAENLGKIENKFRTVNLDDLNEVNEYLWKCQREGWLHAYVSGYNEKGLFKTKEFTFNDQYWEVVREYWTEPQLKN